ISMLLSSDISQSSLEYAEVGLSYFTHYLLEGIEKGYANKNKDNLITIQEAFDYVKLNVQVLTQNQQIPTIGGDFDQSIVMRLL
ncbi:MAG: peptidase C14 caspase catalytic subunit p20, partial [Bacteroidota bacterium]